MGFKEIINAYRTRELVQLTERKRIKDAERERQSATLAAREGAIKRYPEDQQRKAQEFLSQSEFPRLMKDVAEVLGEWDYTFEFNENGEVKLPDFRGFNTNLVKGKANAVGIYIKWHHYGDYYNRIIIEADSNGDIVVHGKNKTKLHPNEWIGKPNVQELVLEEHYKEPYKYEDGDYGEHGWSDSGNPSH